MCLNDFETSEEVPAVIGTFIGPLRPRLAPPAAQVPDPGPCPREAHPPSGLMVKLPLCPENRDHDTVGTGLPPRDVNAAVGDTWTGTA